MYITAINENRDFEFERKQRGAYEKFGGREGRIDIIPQIKELVKANYLGFRLGVEQNKTTPPPPCNIGLKADVASLWYCEKYT